MGWNSFDYYDTQVNEKEVRSNADYMSKNLKSFGWEYIVVDIQWYASDAGRRRSEFQYIPFSQINMDPYGRLIPCEERFPSSKNGKGFALLAEYIHNKGLKFGIHIMRGIPRRAAELKLPIYGTDVTANEIADPYSICDWNPDMYGVRDTLEGQKYYDSIIALYAEWGVDFIKCDDICNTLAFIDKQDSGIKELKMVYHAIQKCGRPIVLSISPGPALLDQAASYIKYANMWRISADFWDNWKQLRQMFEYCEKWQFFVSKGCYPDCDMLPLGYIAKGFGNERATRFTFEEQKTMMTLWCNMHSPLMLGAEMTRLDEQTLVLLTNKNLLEMLKDDFYARQIKKDDSGAVWLSWNKQTGVLFLSLFNFEDYERQMTIAEDEVEEVLGVHGFYGYYEGLDIWEETVGEIKEGAIACQVKAHGVRVWRFESVNNKKEIVE